MRNFGNLINFSKIRKIENFEENAKFSLSLLKNSNFSQK